MSDDTDRLLQLLREGLAQRIQDRTAQSTRPLRAPDLLRELGADVAEGRRALLAGASLGLWSLEPESGSGRLSAADAAWCPEGPQGTRLSWIIPRKRKT